MKKNPSFPMSLSALLLGAALYISSSVAWSYVVNPDLTADGVINLVKTFRNVKSDGSIEHFSSRAYEETYNLGATGLRGWIYINGDHAGQEGRHTEESRQILVTRAEAPSSAVLAVDDVILGAMAGNTGAVPLFSGDCRKQFGRAIGEAEMTGAGVLRVRRWRANTVTDVNISMEIIGNYIGANPNKPGVIFGKARAKIITELKNDSGFLSNDYIGAINGLALLASVAKEDPEYGVVQSRLKNFADSLVGLTLQIGSQETWSWSYMNLFLSEYYLRTKADNVTDSSVLAGITRYTVALSNGQSRFGTFSHAMTPPNPDGSLHGTITPYGPVNSAGIPANIAIVMGKKALMESGLTIDKKSDDEINAAIKRSLDFFSYYVNKGGIPYGEHEPSTTSHASNGKDAMCAVLLGLQNDLPTVASIANSAKFFSRMSVAGCTSREYGHSGQGLSYLWGALGANMGGPLAFAKYMENIQWHNDLVRRTDGSFSYDGQEQYGGGNTLDGSYLGRCGYRLFTPDDRCMNPTSTYVLSYSSSLQRIYLTGRNANSARILNGSEVDDAIAAATYSQTCLTATTSELIAALSAFDPVVRHMAAVQLGKNKLNPANPQLNATELSNLVVSITNGSLNTNPIFRSGACEALGALRENTALDSLGQRLSDTDLWVRASAAKALRSYSIFDASKQVNTMLAAFVNNATPPEVISWNEPMQTANNSLSMALFGDSTPGDVVNGDRGIDISTNTVLAPKYLLYPAIRIGLKQPDSNPRSQVAYTCSHLLPLKDVQALAPEIIADVTTYALADTMWSGFARGEGITALGKYKAAEAVPLALAMMDSAPGYGWSPHIYKNPALNILSSFGEAARWTLPALRQRVPYWNVSSLDYPVLIQTIANIEAAISAPPVIINLLAVASPQLVVTTVSSSKAITLTGTTSRGALTFSDVTTPLHGTLSGTAPNLVYSPDTGYKGPDRFTFRTSDSLTTSEYGTISIIVGVAGTGLKGEYFDNSNFTNLKMTRTDPQLNFDWGMDSPAPSMGADTFSVRWSGSLLIPETGNYTFSALSSDGVRLFINGVPLIDNYLAHEANWKDSAPITLTAGQMVSLQMEYYDNSGSAVAKLKWRGPSLAGLSGMVIAKEWLFDGSGISNQMAYAHPQSVTAVQNTPQMITLTGSGAAQAPLTYSVITQPLHGSLSGIAPNLIYTSVPSYSGSDSFTFIVNNGFSNSIPSAVYVGVSSSVLVSYNWTNPVSGNWNGSYWSNSAGGTVTPAASGNSSYILNFNQKGIYTATQNLNPNFVFNQFNAYTLEPDLKPIVVTIDGGSLSVMANGTLLPQINQNNNNSITFKTPIILDAMTTVSGVSGGSVNINGVVSGSGGLMEEGSGELRLGGLTPNLYSGGTIVNGGILYLGIPDSPSNICYNPVGTGPVTLSGISKVHLERVSANNEFIVNNGTLFAPNGFGAYLTGAITLNGRLTADTPFTLYCGGNINGAGGFSKVGAGVFILSGNNSSTGANEISGGTLQCNSSSSLGVGKLNISASGMVNLNYVGTRAIAALTFNGGVPLLPGTYGSSASSATNRDNTYFSGSGTITILPLTNIALTLSNGSTPSSFGTGLTFTASVTGAAPSGKVAFYAGSTLLGTSALNGSYQASFTTNSLAVGSYKVSANYVGDGSNSGSTSTSLAIEVINRFATPPSNLLVATGNNRINLTWTTSSGATGYNVKRSLTNGGPYTTISSTSVARFDDASAKNDTLYYYVVSAVNASGESVNSTSVAAKVGLSVTSGLVMRMDASQITGTSDGAQLNTWSDTSGAANNAIRRSNSSSGYPKYVASGINGQPVVRFDSADRVNGDAFQFSRISTIRTVFWVIKENAGASDGHFLLGDSASYDFHRGSTPNGPLWDPGYSSSNIRNGTTKLMGDVVNGTTTALPVGNFKLVSLETTGNVSANQICQDRSYHGSWQGDIAEILIYDRTLSGEEDNQVGTYLSNKYGLQTTYNSLPVSSGLVLRMDASKISGTADGAQVNTWSDTSGAANNAIRQSGSSIGYPKFVANGINGQPVVRFNSGVGNTGDFFKFPRITNMRSVFWVFKENTGLTATHFLLGDSATYDFCRGDIPNGPLWHPNFSSSNIRNGITSLMGNTINGTTTSLPSGSFQMVSLVTAGNVQADQICQDRMDHGSWQGDIAEILVYNRALTGSEETAVGTYLATKYGLSTNYPASAILSAPSGVVATPTTSGKVSVSWSPLTGAASYNVWRKNTVDSSVQLVSTGASPFLITGLTNGVSYEFKVSANNSSGVAGSYSSIVTATPALSAACDIATFVVPGQLSSVISSTNINVTMSTGTSVTSLAATYTVSPGSSGNMVSGSNRNFSTPQTYTITAENGTSQKTYTVTLTSATLTWNSGMDGNWSDSTKWTVGISPSDNGLSSYILNFSPAGAYTATNDLNVGFQLNRINFAGSEASLTGNALALMPNGVTLPQFYQGGAGSATVFANLVLNANTSVEGNGAGTVNLAGVISGSGSLTKNSTGDLLLSGPSLYSGGTTVNVGSLFIGLQQNTALGSGPVTLNNGSVIWLNRVTIGNSLTMNNATLAAANGFGDTWSGPISLSGTSTFDLQTTGYLNVSGAVSGSGVLKKVGNSTILLLSGTGNTYSGGTIVSGGTLSCSNAGSLGQGPVTVASGAKLTLNFSGTRQVSTLSLGGISQPIGTYGSSASSAITKNDTYFSGPGVINVTSTVVARLAAAQSAPANTSSATATASELPLPWASGTIGSGQLGGTSTYNGGTISQSGSGALGVNSDKLNFNYLTLSGDGEITAKISALQDTGTLSGVGVMIRETLAADSKHVFMGMAGSNLYVNASRIITGGISTKGSVGTGTAPNTWVKLVRVGDVITASKSLDGITWTATSSTTVTMASNCYIGLAVSSGNDAVLNNSRFTNLSVTP